MKVIAGSHNWGVVDHAETSISPDNLLPSGMEVTCKIREEEAVPVVLKAGQMSLHHVNLVHGSAPNGSQTPRIGFAVRYVSPQVTQKVASVPAVLARGEDRFGFRPLLASPPNMSLQEAIRQQADLAEWVLRTRSMNARAEATHEEAC